MSKNRKKQICALLKGIETGDAASVEVVNEDKYIQHNPQTHEGSLGLAALFKELAKTSPKVNIVRIFSDGDFVFAHTEYDFSQSNIGFEIFRFEGKQAVEHWDNIQHRKGPNASGHSMVDGPTEVVDIDKTEANRSTVRSFLNKVLIACQSEQLERFIDADRFTEHNPGMIDGLSSLRSELARRSSSGGLRIEYERIHRILAEGNFVLSVCEGALGGVQTSFFDLYRLDQGKIVEHWDTTETIPPVSDWKNDNGKF